MTQLLGAACGVAVVAGGMLAVFGLRRTPPSSPGLGLGSSTLRRALTRLRRLGSDPATADGSGWAIWRWPTALGVGLLAWLMSGWPVGGLIVAVTVIGLPMLLTPGRSASRAIEKAESLEEWTRRLADVLVVGVGLEQAIAATVRTCPETIRPQVSGLAARLSARRPVEAALRSFADDLDDAAGDLITATLILGSRRRGPGLAKVLTAVADSLAEEVGMRRKVEAERAKPRTTARAVTLITLGVVAVGALNGSYLQPYGTPLGQLVLATLSAGFVGALAWMHALTIAQPAPRMLARVSANPGDDTGEGQA
jgi:tight adherence protein B